jgi:zinc transport system substrate-binding protein
MAAERKTVILIISITFAFLSLQNSLAAEQLTVYAVNYPLKYFAERIGGEHVKSVFPAPDDVDPAYWMPDTATIAGYQQADLILLNGAGYAGWVDKVSLARSKLINTSRDFRDQYITMESAVSHSHGPGGAHAHEGAAFTTWIDFNLAARQAKAIADAFSRKKAGRREIFQKNYSALERELMEIDQKIKKLTSKEASKPLLGSHPVYDYFARRYGLNMQSVHWEPDEAPTDAQWAELQSILAKHPAQWMIWEGEPIKESTQRLKAIGVDSLVFDPCGNTPVQEDFLSVMRQNVENLNSAFK